MMIFFKKMIGMPTRFDITFNMRLMVRKTFGEITYRITYTRAFTYNTFCKINKSCGLTCNTFTYTKDLGSVASKTITRCKITHLTAGGGGGGGGGGANTKVPDMYGVGGVFGTQNTKVTCTLLYNKGGVGPEGTQITKVCTNLHTCMYICHLAPPPPPPPPRLQT